MGTVIPIGGRSRVPQDKPRRTPRCPVPEGARPTGGTVVALAGWRRPDRRPRSWTPQTPPEGDAA